MRFATICAASCILVVFGAIQCGSNDSGSGFTSPDQGDGSADEGGNPLGFGAKDGAFDGPPLVVDKCHVPPDNGNAPTCTTPAAPPNSFSPVLKWKWADPTPGSIGVWTIPLVANLTDDDGNGEVNLCDIPDVVIESAGGGEFSRSGRLYMLRGSDGMVESTFSDTVVDGDSTPAIADLDGDKVPEVIAIDKAGHVLIFDNKGAVKNTGDVALAASDMYSSCGAISVYDLDADGKPEIIYGFEVLFIALATCGAIACFSDFAADEYGAVDVLAPQDGAPTCFRADRAPRGADELS